MDQLAQKLANPRRRALGTCAVLLWGPPGCGKSQIAREYLWRHRNDYPAGCFWIDCKTEESRSKSFWEIAQAVAIYGDEPSRDPAWDESSKFVGVVRKWFEAREGWLLVFDGITTDNDDDIGALASFIPDRIGSNIIYTSVDRTLAKRQRLLNPAGVKVFPLSQHDACALLYKNLDIKSPTESQAKKAMQLVKHYECLPLAVHAAAHALIARGISLEKFSPGTSDHRLAEPYLDILTALREHSHPEAVNMVTLLSFFAHVIPVALIRFGQPVLQEFGVEIRSIESIGSMKKELDNTIAVLIRYGLVERTLLEYCVATPNKSSPTETRPRRAATVSTIDSDRREPHLLLHDSSSLENMVEARPDSRVDGSSSQSVTYSIDILRIHTVVQSVLRDELRFRYADQPAQYWGWLCIASRMLTHSYTVADGKIKSTEGRGLVRDYREYDTQAARLWSHFPKSSADASSVLRKTRHNLHETIRAIKQEIKSQSPSQSIDTLNHQVQFSVFERANSTSSDSPTTTSSDLTRTSTWTPEHADNQTESPTQMHSGLDMDDVGSEESWTERWSQSGMGNSRVLVPGAVLSRRPSNSEVSTTGLTEASSNAARRSSILHALFQGHPSQAKKPKDLGEWKAIPVPPSLSQEQAQARSRASSFTSGSDDRTTRPTSTGSEASGALAAIHRASPPPSRGGRIKSPTRSQCGRPASEDGRQPLSVKSPNQKLSPLATAFQPGQSLPADSEVPRRHSRHPSSSPRLIQTALNNQAATRAIPIIPPDENMASQAADSYSKSVPMIIRPVPSGYTSQPMSRDSSRESNVSLATAPPAVPGSASLGTSPQIREPYLYSRPGLASIDVVAANSWEDALAGVGELATTSPPAPVMAFDESAIFERYHERFGGSVQFGNMSPVELDQARARVSLAREHSADGRVGRAGRQDRH
ncbi:LipA and NB-ARC domain protein [Cladophialophora carrionii]|uniref:LipA and NB-ARC domain protein n=1 Tax=Cladophialophora carrionii TaxID=86049 RepID=A0A1C1C692_9EURO|nr:LipA and NB-ARC domain protein [Cladophialophora carrionii]